MGATIALSAGGGYVLSACKVTTEPPKPAERGPQALRIPNIILGTGTITAAVGSAEFWNGITSPDIITINGAILGPTIKVRKGNSLNIHFNNNLSQVSNIHWHGLTVPAEMDGHPKDAVAAGKGFDYSFKILDRAGTYWYHAHPDMMTGEQIYKGLAGLVIVNDDAEDALGMPTREFDVPLILQDKRVNEKNQVIWDKKREDVAPGFLGETVFVNGTPDAFHKVTKGLYRFRIVNASNARIFNVGFEDKRMMNLIANDGGLLEKPIPVTSVKLSPGERADVLVDFSGDMIGASLKLKSFAFTYTSDHQNVTYPQGKEYDILRFDITGGTTNSYKVPAALLPFDILDTTNPAQNRYMALTMNDAVSTGQHQINDLVFEMDRIDFQVKLGDIEVWFVENKSSAGHGMHIHGLQFQIIERSGATLAPTDMGWKDTISLGPSESARIALRFTTYKGRYLFHCHLLEHEDDGMMLNLEVI